MMIKKQDVLDILSRLLEQAVEVEAASGQTPSAEEALDWATTEVQALTDLPD
jgi:hypothetical protein